MPTLQKVYTLEVTPDQFLDSCSREELMAVDLLLQSNRFQRIMYPESSENFDKSTEFLEIAENYFGYCSINPPFEPPTQQNCFDADL